MSKVLKERNREIMLSKDATKFVVLKTDRKGEVEYRTFDYTPDGHKKAKLLAQLFRITQR
jgi:hypothetical protein